MFSGSLEMFGRLQFPALSKRRRDAQHKPWQDRESDDRAEEIADLPIIDQTITIVASGDAVATAAGRSRWYRGHGCPVEIFLQEKRVLSPQATTQRRHGRAGHDDEEESSTTLLQPDVLNRTAVQRDRT
jgi:hypothetical protein